MIQNKAIQITLFLLRVTAAYMFLLNGTAKLFHVPHIAPFDNLQLFSLLGVAGILELGGGLLLLLGLFTRPTAFIVAGEMAVAYFMGHASQGNPLFPLLNEGQPAVLFCFVFLFFAAYGGGKWSLDEIFGIGRKSQTP